MARPFSISEETLKQIRALKEQGYSDRRIAEIFKIAKSTIWDNLYRREEKIVLSPWRKIDIAKQVIRLRKQQGRNSLQVSEELQIPLQEVNQIYIEIRV